MNDAFTLIELLIVIGIIAILAAAIIIAISPGEMLASARDSTRESHLHSLETAIFAYQLREGVLPPGIDNTLKEICNTNDDDGIEPSNCQLHDLVDLSITELPRIPVDPSGGFHDHGTGYFVRLGSIFLEAPRAETRMISTGSNPNLVLNEFGQLGDMTNFSQFDAFGTEEFYEGTGSFRVTSDSNISRMTDSLVPIDTSSTYEVCTAIKGEWTGEQPTFYAGIASYDADELSIGPRNVTWEEGSETQLSDPLSPTDTEIHLVDSTNWYDGPSSHRRSVGMHPYTNNQGYTYPDFTYTRHVGSAVWWDEGAIDRTNHIVQLNQQFGLHNPDHPEGVWPTGSLIANHSSGNTFMYTAASNVLTPAEWQEFCGTSSGLSTPGTHSNSSFRQGTEYVRFLWLLNRTGDGAERTSWVDSVKIEKVE